MIHIVAANLIFYRPFVCYFADDFNIMCSCYVGHLLSIHIVDNTLLRMALVVLK